jgi:hypothetical protein
MNSSFTPTAQILWDAIPSHFQEQVLHNIWCPHCADMTTMTDCTGEVHGRSLVLIWYVCDLSRKGGTSVGRSI